MVGDGGTLNRRARRVGRREPDPRKHQKQTCNEVPCDRLAQGEHAKGTRGKRGERDRNCHAWRRRPFQRKGPKIKRERTAKQTKKCDRSPLFRAKVIDDVEPAP